MEEGLQLLEGVWLVEEGLWLDTRQMLSLTSFPYARLPHPLVSYLFALIYIMYSQSLMHESHL